MSQAPREPDLDALLDDALEAFDHAAGLRPGAATAPSVSGAAPPVGPEAPSTSAAAAPTSAPTPTVSPACLPGQPAGGAPKGLGLDPLSRRRAPGGPPKGAAAVAGTAGSTAGAAAGGTAAGLQDMDVLAQGLSQLLAELARAEDQGETSPGSSTSVGDGAGPSSTAAGTAADPQQHGQQQQRDLGATLRALSEQAPSFEGSGEQAGLPSDDELLRLLAEQLGGLTGAGADAAGGTGAGTAGSTGGTDSSAAPPGMSSFVDSLMQQLLSKDVLYQPMKDIGERYPAWLAANEETLSAEDRERYNQQLQYIRRICALYETHPSDYTQLVELLQQMQQCGQPPQEIVDELAPGMQFGPDGLPTFGGGEEGLPAELKDCVIQ